MLKLRLPTSLTPRAKARVMAAIVTALLLVVVLAQYYGRSDISSTFTWEIIGAIVVGTFGWLLGLPNVGKEELSDLVGQHEAFVRNVVEMTKNTKMEERNAFEISYLVMSHRNSVKKIFQDGSKGARLVKGYTALLSQMEEYIDHNLRDGFDLGSVEWRKVKGISVEASTELAKVVAGLLEADVRLLSAAYSSSFTDNGELPTGQTIRRLY